MPPANWKPNSHQVPTVFQHQSHSFNKFIKCLIKILTQNIKILTQTQYQSKRNRREHPLNADESAEQWLSPNHLSLEQCKCSKLSHNSAEGSLLVWLCMHATDPCNNLSIFLSAFDALCEVYTRAISRVEIKKTCIHSNV